MLLRLTIVMVLTIPGMLFSSTKRFLMGKTPKFLETTQCIIKYLPDGEHILAAWDYNIRLISLKSGKTLRSWWTSYPIWDMTLSKDGKMFAVATSGHSGNTTGRISVWKVSSKKKIWDLRSIKNMGYIGRLAFSPDGEYLAGAGDPQSLIVWNLKTGSTSEIKGLKYGNVSSLTFHPAKNTAVIGNLYRELPKKTQLFPDTRAYSFDLNTMTLSGSFSLWDLPPDAGSGGINSSDVPEDFNGYFEWEKYTLIPHYSGNWTAHSVDYSKKGRFILAAGPEVSIYNADTGEKLLTYVSKGSTHFYAAFSPSDKHILVSGMRGFELYDAVKGTALTAYPVTYSPGFYPLRFDFSPDGKHFIYAEYERNGESTEIYAKIQSLEE